MKKIYETAIENLLEIISTSVNTLKINHHQYDENLNPLILLGDQRLGSYSSIVATNEYRAAKVIEQIAIAMFEQSVDLCFEYYPIDKIYTSLPQEEQKKTRPFQIILTESNKKHGVIFTNMCDVGEYSKRFIDGKYSVDALKIVILAEPNSFAKASFFDEVNSTNRKLGVAIERIPVMDFWCKYFGNESCDELRSFCNDFNNRVTPLIGFNTVVVPTEKALHQFKEKCGDNIFRYKDSYIQITPNTIINGQSQTSIMVNNYFDRGLWRAIIGSSNFANSFITSEWFYTMYQLTENLDLTSVVAGYLKSIEQLIFAIIDLPREEIITIKSKERKSIKFSKDNIDSIDTTLWSLEKALDCNSKILDITGYAKRHLVETIGDWRKKERNGYFHLHNLHSIEKVKEIREKALYLYFLILGSCMIKEEHFTLLGIN